MTETQLRFLREVATRVGADRIADIYVFPAIRQGGIESGVAVVAAQAEHPAEATGEGFAVAALPDGMRQGELTFGEPAAGEPSEASREPSEPSPGPAPELPAEVPAGPSLDPSSALPAGPGDERCDPTEAASGPADGDGDGPGDDEPRADGSEDHEPLPHEAPPTAAERLAASRLVVLNARYRHVLKGPDRGKWEIEITAEADAPAAAIETVVRGVQRRAGESADAEHLTGPAFREALAAPEWTVVR